jgi:CRISP-associated protein Cas1
MTRGDSAPSLSADRAPIAALQPISKRISFVYLDRCVVHRDANAIVAMSEDGTTRLPAAAISALLLGPGTRVTHQAMNLLGESGAVTCWVGEGGARLYASAPSLSRSTRLLEEQARLVSNRSSRLAVARTMYLLRFPEGDVSRATMQQLRGMEGARVRRAYRSEADRTGVEWKGRRYDPENWSDGDVVNRALSAANSCLYGVIHAVVVAVGCSTGLGFVHTGHVLAFVYDIADLYKAEVTIPAAFTAASEGEANLAARVRRLVRSHIYEHRVLDRAVDDIRYLLLGTRQGDENDEEGKLDTLVLWDADGHTAPAGVAYGDES